MRIAKAMARAGLCSRREAERWIADGRVSVNGKLLSTPAFEVGPRDRITIDGEPLPEAEPVRLWRYHKPRGLVTTHKDPEGRPTVFDNLPPDLPRVISIGRLDYNTEGLLLLTTDGALARHLELPATGWLRRYRVRARGRVKQAQLDALKAGIVDRRRQLRPDRSHARQRARRQRLADDRPARGQEPRDPQDPGPSRARGRPPDPGLVRAVPVARLCSPGRPSACAGACLREQLGAKLARELGVIAGTEAAPKEERPQA